MIKSLDRTLKQDKQPFAVPKSVQHAIPIRRVWPDGIFLCDGKFSKCWRFEDINYAIAGKSDKTEMFLDYSELLNALDSGATAKITINNRRINRADFEKNILLPPSGDGLDDLRKEYNDMLLDKITGSGNSIVQERYITVSVFKKTVEEARAYFARVGTDLTAHLGRLSSSCAELDAAERLRIFHDFFRPGEEAHFRYDMAASAKKGHGFLECVCPESLEFPSGHFRMGEKLGRVLYLREYASYIKDSMLMELCELNRNLMVSIDIIPIPTDEAVREIQNKLLGIETNVSNWQRKQNAANNFSAVIPYDMELQRKETKEFLDDLTTRDQRMMFVIVTLTHTAGTLEQLNADTDSLLSVGRKHLCQLAILRYQQLDGLNTSLPYGVRRIDALRTLTTESTAVLMPFKAQEIRHDRGIYAGRNAISKNLLFIDRKQLINGNGFVLGVSGSGKSFVAKRELLHLALAGSDDDILVVDPENEYAGIVRELGGEVIRIAATSRNHINAMDMVEGYGDGENPIILKSEFILSLCEQLVGNGKLSAKEKSLIDRCTANVYRKYLQSNYRDTPPTLQDFHAELIRQDEPEARDVALAIELFTSGSLNTFAQQTNVNPQNRIVCYDVRDLGKQLLPIGMLVVLDSIFNRVVANRLKGKNTWIIIDEIYLLFQHEYSANFLYALWKRVRKYGACATGLTQNIDDLLQSHTARTMLANSEYLVMLNQAATDRIELAKLLNISENQLSYITNVPSGYGLLKCGSNIVPFEDRFPTNTRMYQLMTTKPNEKFA